MTDPISDAPAGEPVPRPVPGRAYVQVALNLPVATEFTYLAPHGVDLRPGNRVRVPFRRKILAGVVVRTAGDPGSVDPARIREVAEVVDRELVLPESLLRLGSRIAAEYGCSLGETLDAMLPALVKRRGARRIPHLELAVAPAVARERIAELEDRFEAQARVLAAVLEAGGPIPVLEAQRLTKTSASPWSTLLRKGLLRRVSLEEEGQPLEVCSLEAAPRHQLNPAQQAAVEAAAAAAARRTHSVFLLHGVTGSGKTEVYLRILEEVRSLGRGAVVLVPEISLTPQTVGRFASRFPDVAVLHSGLTGLQRAEQWQRLRSGQAAIAIGARSALFAPVRDLGLIVVDEEHESTFKQESKPRYHAREMAVARGEIENAVVVLGSATPSLESYGRAKRGVYHLLELPERAGQGTMPRVLVEDLTVEPDTSMIEGVCLSRTLRALMAERLQARDQIILFLNRRGYSPVLMCPKCGTPARCDHCAISMTMHRRRGRLVCHYCNSERRIPTVCPVCTHGRFHDLGVGTERVEVAVKQVFPAAIVQRMDADTMAKRGAHERVLQAFRRRHIDVLIGTQMIAKGLDFPDVTLVGVISADTGLLHPDFRAAERTFQLLFQVAGRAGRGDKAGTVVIQTFAKDNYAVQAAARLDYAAFVQRELGMRKEVCYPPFCRLIRVLIEGRREPAVVEAALAIRAGMPRHRDVAVLGPHLPAIAKLKDRYRRHLLVKALSGAGFAAAMDDLRGVESRTTSTLRVALDVDPGTTA